MKQAKATSPVAFKFRRNGGADVQAEVQVWIMKDEYEPADRPVSRVRFANPLASQEILSAELSNGSYICVLLGIAREALNGVYSAQLEVEDHLIFERKGDANTSPQPGDIVNFRADFELRVQS